MEKLTYTSPFINDKGFIMHDSFLFTFLRVWEHHGSEEACKFIKAIGLYAMGQGVDQPDDEDSVWVYGLPHIFFMIDVDAGRAQL